MFTALPAMETGLANEERHSPSEPAPRRVRSTKQCEPAKSFRNLLGSRELRQRTGRGIRRPATDGRTTDPLLGEDQSGVHVSQERRGLRRLVGRAEVAALRSALLAVRLVSSSGSTPDNASI